MCVTTALAVVLATAGMSTAGIIVASSPQNSVPAAQEPGPAASGSILDGVFTLGQASRGQQIFQRACTSCHEATEHTGRRFAGKWGGFSMGELFDLVMATMPESDPGSLPPEEYASILAFFLKESGYPDGMQELPADVSALTKIRIDPIER